MKYTVFICHGFVTADLDPPVQIRKRIWTPGGLNPLALFIEEELDFGLGKLTDAIKHKSLRKRLFKSFAPAFRKVDANLNKLLSVI